MKNRVLYVLLVLMMSMLCIGCSKDINTDADQPVTNNEQQNDVEGTVENTEETVVPENVGRTKIEDEAIIADVTELLNAEYKLCYHLSCEWPVDQSQEYEIDDVVYYLVDVEGATSWEYYDNLAREVYSEAYIKEEFTPRYKRLYVEDDGKLYRAPADGIVNPLVEDSIEVFESAEGRYYVTVFEESINGEYETARIIEVAEGSKYGYLIVDVIGYIK